MTTFFLYTSSTHFIDFLYNIADGDGWVLMYYNTKTLPTPLLHHCL